MNILLWYTLPEPEQLNTHMSTLRRLQVCTGVMIHGYPVIKNLCGGLQVHKCGCVGLVVG